jgi:putative endonuclease
LQRKAFNQFFHSFVSSIKGRLFPVSDKIKKGREGEEMAARFLIDKGFEIVERNYRYKRLEIDLIVKKDNWLIFVEVKLRSSDAYGYPEDFVDYKKAKNIVDGAEQYTYDKNWQGNVRYDIVSIRLQQDQTEIIQIEDAFY